MVLAAAGCQNRRGETAKRTRGREHQRVLKDGEQRGKGRNTGQDRKACLRRDQRMQFHARERRQVKDTDARPLQDQAVIVRAVTPAPAAQQQGDTNCRHARVTEFDPHGGVFGDIAQQEGQAQEEDQHPDLDERIAAGDPAGHEFGEPRRHYGCWRLGAAIFWRVPGRPRLGAGFGRRLAHGFAACRHLLQGGISNRDARCSKRNRSGGLQGLRVFFERLRGKLFLFGRKLPGRNGLRRCRHRCGLRPGYLRDASLAQPQFKQIDAPVRQPHLLQQGLQPQLLLRRGTIDGSMARQSG